MTAFAPATAEACNHWLRGGITGGNFVDGVTVRLMRDGEPDLVGKLFSNLPADPVLVDFWITGGTALGSWDLEVTNPDGQSSGLADVLTVAPDPACPFGAVGDLYIADVCRDKIMQFDGQSGTPIGDFVSKRFGGLNDPWAIAFGPTGNLFVTAFNADAGDGILEYDGDTGAFVGEFVPLVFSSEPLAVNGWLGRPVDLTFGPNGDLFVVAHLGDSVERYDGQTGEWLGHFAIGGAGPGLDKPWALRFAPNGNLLVAYGGAHSQEGQYYGVAEFHGATGRLVRTIGFGGGPDTGSAIVRAGLDFAPSGDLWVIEWLRGGLVNAHILTSKVIGFDFATGEHLGTVIPDGAGGMSEMRRIMVEGGSLFVLGLDEESWGTVVEFDAATAELVGTFTDIGLEENLLPCPRGFAFRPGPPDASPGPVISGVSVSRIDACESLSGVTVRGTNLFRTTRVKLARDGDPPYPDYLGIVTARSGDGTVLRVDFDLDGGVIDSGVWNVAVTNADGQADTLVGSVEVTACRSAGGGNLLVSVLHDRNKSVSGIIEFAAGSGDVIGWFAADLFAVNEEGELTFVNGMEFGPNGNLFVAADWPGPEPDARYVIEFDGVTGRRLGEFVPARSGGLLWPYDLTFGPNGNLFVLHHESDAFWVKPWLAAAGVLEFDGLTGGFVRTFVEVGACGLVGASKLEFGPHGNLFITTYDNGVLEFDGTTGACLGAFVPQPTEGTFWLGLVFSPHTDNLLVNRGFTHPELGIVGEILEYDVAGGGAALGTFVEPGSAGLRGTLNANGIVYGPSGDLFVSSWSIGGKTEVLRFDGRTGDALGTFAFHHPNKLPTSSVYELAFRPRPGDWDGDSDLDLRDVGKLQMCFGSSAGGETLGDYWCLRFDTDHDGDVDAHDVARLTRDMTGPR